MSRIASHCTILRRIASLHSSCLVWSGMIYLFQHCRNNDQLAGRQLPTIGSFSSSALVAGRRRDSGHDEASLTPHRPRLPWLLHHNTIHDLGLRDLHVGRLQRLQRTLNYISCQCRLLRVNRAALKWYYAFTPTPSDRSEYRQQESCPMNHHHCFCCCSQ